MFSNTEELLPVISFNAKTSTDEQKKHDDFVDRMMEKATPVNKCAYCANGICAYVNRLNNPGPVHMPPGLQLDSEPWAEKRRRRRSIRVGKCSTGGICTWFIDRRLNGEKQKHGESPAFFTPL